MLAGRTLNEIVGSGAGGGVSSAGGAGGGGGGATGLLQEKENRVISRRKTTGAGRRVEDRRPNNTGCGAGPFVPVRFSIFILEPLWLLTGFGIWSPSLSDIRGPGRSFVLSLASQLADLGAVGQHRVYLLPAGSVRFENEVSSVGRPVRTFVVA